MQKSLVFPLVCSFKKSLTVEYNANVLQRWKSQPDISSVLVRNEAKFPSGFHFLHWASVAVICVCSCQLLVEVCAHSTD